MNHRAFVGVEMRNVRNLGLADTALAVHKELGCIDRNVASPEVTNLDCPLGSARQPRRSYDLMLEFEVLLEPMVPDDAFVILLNFTAFWVILGPLRVWLECKLCNSHQVRSILCEKRVY
jgi:hypothetical protein